MANVIEITDFSAPELDVYARLTEAQLLNRFEPAKGMFIAESPKVIHRALDGGYEPVSLLMERKDIMGAAAERKIAPTLVGFWTFSRTTIRAAPAQISSRLGSPGRRMAHSTPRVRW